MSKAVQIILCTCPDHQTAETIARLLVERNLAACVNILPGLTSYYRWQGQIESAQELLLLIKTNSGRYPAVETAILENHPYELPEIIAIPVDQGLPDYLHWIDSCLSAN